LVFFTRDGAQGAIALDSDALKLIGNVATFRRKIYRFWWRKIKTILFREVSLRQTFVKPNLS